MTDDNTARPGDAERQARLAHIRRMADGQFPRAGWISHQEGCFLLDELDAAQSALAETADERDRWHQNCLSEQDRAIVAERALAESRRANQTLVHDVTEWRERYHAALAELAESRAEVARLRAELTIREGHVAEWRTEATRLKADLDLHIGMHGVTVEQYENLRAELSRATIELARLRSPTATGEDREAVACALGYICEVEAIENPELDIDPCAELVALAQGRAPLFVDGEFTAHSGETLPFKIECDALTDADLATLAAEIARRVKFSQVVGVPRGGLRLADALTPYLTPGHGTLIVDDVLTTGASMEEYRQRFPGARGFVIFARGPCPDWVTPLFGDAVRSPTATGEDQDIALAFVKRWVRPAEAARAQQELIEYLAAARAPTATGDDREAIARLVSAIRRVASIEAGGMWFVENDTVASDRIGVFLREREAAARAQGVRRAFKETLEREDEAWSRSWHDAANLIRERISALAAPEPQEEKL